jgi:hypothetical protein
MKNLRWIVIVVLVAGLALSLAACGGEEPTATPVPTEVGAAPTDSSAPEPTDTPLPPPTDTPPSEPADTPLPEPTTEPEPEPEGGEGFDAALLEQPNNLDSFRSTVEISWQGVLTDGTDVSNSMVMLFEFVRDPLAQHISIAGEFPGMEELGMEEGATLDIYVIEGMMYMNLFGGWMQMPAEEDTADIGDMAFVATDEMIGELQDAKYEGKETYNGIETKHYSFDESSFSSEDAPEGMEIEEASGNIYIAVEGNYVVHMDVTMSGSNLEIPTGEGSDMLQGGSMTIMVDLSDINESFTIEVPPEAKESGGMPEDIPLPPDAEEVSNLMGMITFQSPTSSEEIAEFYKTQMPENGWTETSVEEFSGMYMMEYSKEGRTASFIISLDSDTGNTSVLITVSEE